MDGMGSTEDAVMRIAAVVDRGLSAGSVANIAAIVIGGLQSKGFSTPIFDKDKHAHASIFWNLVILESKSNAQLTNLLIKAHEMSVKAIAFTNQGKELSNNYSEYKNIIEMSHSCDLRIIGVGLFGQDDLVRSLTRSFSFFK